jgi:redox-regulated HSP33 family molecular chaperone
VENFLDSCLLDWATTVWEHCLRDHDPCSVVVRALGPIAVVACLVSKVVVAVRDTSTITLRGVIVGPCLVFHAYNDLSVRATASFMRFIVNRTFL